MEEEILQAEVVQTDLAVVESSTDIIPETEQEDPSLMAGIILKTFDDVTDTSVLKSIKDAFRGFTFDPSEDFSKRFQTADQLATYVEESLTDISKCRQQAETTGLLNAAASMARFWCMSRAMDTAIKNGSYRASVSNTIAASLRRSVPYVYSIRAVSERLSLTDCYLLGMRGCTTTTLRRLAQIKDNVTRKHIVTSFVTDAVNTADCIAMEEARKKLNASINAAQCASLTDGTALIGECTSDPISGGSDTAVSEEYSALMKQLTTWQKLMKKPAQEEAIEGLCRVAEQFYISENTPNAETFLANIKSVVKDTKELLQKVAHNIEDALRELTSVEASEVLTNESADSSAGN